MSKIDNEKESKMNVSSVSNITEKINKSKGDSSMPIEDKITLSPIDKYRIYGRFPFKMLIHLLLIFATSMQAMIVINSTTDYCRGQERVFYNNLISEGDKEDPDFPRTYYLYSIEQLREHLKWSLDNMQNFADNSLEKVIFENDSTNEFTMEIDYIDKKNETENLTLPMPINFQYQVDPNYLGPFNENYTENDIKQYLDLVDKFSIFYFFETYVPFYYEEHKECFGWKIYQEFDFTQRAHFVVSLNIQRTPCSDETKLNYYQIVIARFLWVHIVVMFLSMASLFLTWKNLYQIARIYWFEKNLSKKKEISYGSSKKAKASFNKWQIITLIGNILQFLSGIVGMLDKENMNASTDVLVGFGCMFAYFNVGKYLDYDIEYSTIYATLQRALPNVIRFLIGVIPIFIGFIFFGVCVFWRSERFFNTSSTMMSLFSMINGDSIYDIISDLSGISFFLGQVYSYSFCILFIVVVMNVFISIIEEAYVSSKMRNQNHWIYNYLKIDPSFSQMTGVGEGGIEIPDVDNMTQAEIKQELSNRIKKLEEGLEKCEGLVSEVETIKDDDIKQNVRKYLRAQLDEIEKKLEKMRRIWEQRNN